VLIDINLNNDNGKYHCIIRYPDSQILLNTRIDLIENIPTTNGINIYISLDSAEKIILLMQSIDYFIENQAYKNQNIDITYHILYAYAARSDRVFKHGDSHGISSWFKPLAQYINASNASNIKFDFLDIHNRHHIECIIESINNQNMLACTPNLNFSAIEVDNSLYDILILPDEGAKNRVKFISFNNLHNIVYCKKSRDLDGKITLTVENSELCKNKKCIIIDDLCDGGGTFLAIADNIQPKTLTLQVTHGIFSKGVDVLLEKFDHIITTNSYTKQPVTIKNNPKITLINVQKGE
jgi:ribose-phosphate pyrophosphokinase